ncbi:MAG: transposase [Brevibacillus sp.]|nr:transposase [Brevibacillus sp.]
MPEPYTMCKQQACTSVAKIVETNPTHAVFWRTSGKSRSGYYKWKDRPESDRERRHKEWTEQVKEVYDESRKLYGEPEDYQQASSARCEYLEANSDAHHKQAAVAFQNGQKVQGHNEFQA